MANSEVKWKTIQLLNFYILTSYFLTSNFDIRYSVFVIHFSLLLHTLTLLFAIHYSLFNCTLATFKDLSK